MTGPCGQCAKVRRCAEAGPAEILAGHSCALFERAGEPELRARAETSSAYGARAVAHALKVPEGKGEEVEEQTKGENELLPKNFWPEPGTAWSRRQAQLDGMRYIHVRNAAQHVYTKPDPAGGPPVFLLTAAEVLQMGRQEVKKAVLDHELASGTIVPDAPTGTMVPSIGAAQAAQGADVNQPFQQPPLATGPSSPVASQIQQPVPAPQPQPPPQDLSGRKKRAGAAVAGPPAAPAQQAAPGQAFIPQSVQQQLPFQPQTQMGQQQAVFQPAAAPQAFAPQTAPAQAAQTAPAAVDLRPVFERLDLIGRMLEETGRRLEENERMQKRLLAALHHVYLTDVNQQAPTRVSEFSAFLDGYAGNPK